MHKILQNILLLLFFSIFSKVSYTQCSADSGPDAFICPGGGGVQIGGPVAGTGSGILTYSWAPVAFLSCNNCPNPISTTNITRTYTLTVTDGTGCIATDNVTVTIAANPTASFTASGGNNQCANLPINFTNTSNGAVSYSWNFGDPGSGVNNTSTATSPSHLFTAVGNTTQNFTVTLVATNAAGCQATSIQTVTVRQTPGPDLFDPLNNFRNCNSLTGIYDLTVFDMSAAANNTHFQIQWGDGTADFNSGAFPGAGTSHTYSVSGVFDLVYIVTDANGCVDSTLIPVANTSNPSIGLASLGGTAGCAPLNICIQINGIAGNHNSTFYVVDYGDGTPADTFAHPPPAQVCHTYLTSSCPSTGTAGYTFGIRAINLCSSTLATVGNIQVASAPEANINASPLISCVNTPVNFSNNSTLGYNLSCGRGTTFTWDFGDGTGPQTVVTANPVLLGNIHSYSNPGVYDVILSSSNICGLTDDTIQVCIEEPPTPNFSVNVNTACIPFDVATNDLSVIATNCNMTLNWSSPFIANSCAPFTGTSSFINGTNANSLEPEFRFSSPGTFQITQTLSNSCGNFTATQNITAQAPPDIGINPVSSICGGQTISPTGIFNDCLEPINSYLWDFTGSSTATSNAQVPGVITYPTNGAYTITLTATNNCGTDIATTPLTVNTVPPVLNPFTVSPLCAGYNADFLSDTVVGATYNWSGPNGFLSNQQNPTITNVSAADAGTYTVFASFGSCSGASQTVDLVVLPITFVDAGPDLTNCIDDASFTVVPVTPAGGVWSGNGINAAGLFDPALAGSGAHTLTYTFTDPGTLCVYSDDVIATVNSLPVVDAGPDISLCNQPIANTLTPITPANGTWSGPGVTDPAGEFTPSANGVFEIYYSFTNGNGCFNEDTLLVTVINPTNADAGIDSTICENGNNVQLTGSPAGGTWTGVGISAAGDYDPTVFGTFTMTYTFGSGTCQTSDQMDFIVNPAPTVDAGADFTICLDGGTIDLSALPNPVGGSWSGNGITNPNGTFDPLIAGNGSHTLTYTYTDPLTNCSNTDILTATVNPLPVVNAGNDTILCNQPLPVQLNGLPAGGVWSGPNVDVAGVFTPTETGAFTLYYSFILSSCSAVDSMVVTVVNPSQADAGIDQELCFSNTQIQFSGLPAGGTWTGTGIAANGDYTPNVPGNYDLVYSFGGGNCLTRDTMNLTVYALPVVDAGSDATFCESEAAVNFVGSPLNGSWSGSGVTNAIFGTFDPSIASLGNNTITYTYTDPATTCTNTDDLIATINPLPNVNFSFNPIVCTGVSENFTNNSLLGNTFEWDFGDNTAIDPASDPTHSYSTIGFYNIQLTVTTIFGCIDSLSLPIEVREAPTANFTLAPDSSCGPLIVSFTNNSTGIAPLTFSWNFGNGQVSNIQNPGAVTFVAGILADTTYYVSLDVTNFCGTVSASDSVKIMPVPVAIFGPQFDVGCSPFTLQFANNSYGLPDTYDWDFGDGSTSTSPNALFNHIFVTGANDTTYTIQLVVNNECGTDTADYTITVLPTSVNAFFNTDITSGCVPLTVDFTNFSSGAQFNSWDFDDGNSTNQTSPSHTFNQAGTYNVRLIVNDDCSIDTTFATITVHPQPVMDFSFAPVTACVGESITFTNLSNGVSNISWDFDDGTNSVLTNPVHAFGTSGTFQVTLTGTSTLFGCQSGVTHPVNIAVTPTPSFTVLPNSGCIPVPIAFTNTSQNFNFINWDFGDGNVTSASSPTHIYDVPGNYTVKLVVENNIGCKDSTTAIVQAFPLPTADFDFVSIDSCNIPSQVVVSNLSLGSTGYAWNFGNGFNSTLTNPSTFYNVAGTYFVKLVVSNQYGCQDSIIKDLTIFSPPVANFVISDPDICVGESIVGTSISLLADSVKWFMGDGVTYTSNVINHIYQNSGTYFIALVAYGQGICSDTMFAQTPVTVNVTPIANFNYTNVEEENNIDGTIDFFNMSSFANSYLWEFEGGATSTVTNPRYKFDYFGNAIVTLVAFNVNGCVDSITKTVKIDYYKGLFVPNAMNPGHPDAEVAVFMPKGVGLSTYHVTIYDDWGNLIWESTALDGYGRPTEYWDGTFNGIPVQQDAYVWKIEATYMTSEMWEGKQYSDGKFKRSGTITVIR